MYPDSPFAVPVGSFQTPVPVVDVDPDTGDLVTVCFNPAWLPYIIGCLKQLLLQTTWDTTDAAVLSQQQARAFTLIGQFQEGLMCPTGILFDACDSPDCGIKISTDGGTTWTCIDLSTCIATIWDEKLAQAFDDGVFNPHTEQPGPVTPPSAFECHSFHVVLPANSAWLCPFPVSETWTILVENVTGGWADGSGLWFCPDGGDYILGTCGSPGSHESGDPLNPGSFHMALVGNFGSTWFDPLAGLYTVPIGTSTTDFTLQANDGTLSDNYGQIEFDVTVCSSAPWCRHFDFTTSDGGWQAVNAGGTDFAVYSTGVGWTSIYNHAGSNTTETRIVKTFSTINFTLLEFIFEFDTTSGVSTHNVFADSNSFTGSDSIGSGSGQTLDQVVDLDGHTSLRGDLAKASSGGGSIIITGVTVRGTGDNPFGTSNCT